MHTWNRLLRDRFQSRAGPPGGLGSAITFEFWLGGLVAFLLHPAPIRLGLSSISNSTAIAVDTFQIFAFTATTTAPPSSRVGGLPVREPFLVIHITQTFGIFSVSSSAACIRSS